MTTQHPLDKLAAAVDGGLDHDTREKVLSHLVGCDSCRAEVEAQRRLKASLLELDGPEPSADLMQRLLGVPAFTAEPREEVRPVPTLATSLSPQRSVFPAAQQGGTRPAARSGQPRARRRTTVLGAAGSAAAVATLLGTAFVVGDPARQEQPPLVQPPVSSFSADYASTMNGYPFGDPAVLLTTFAPSGQGVLEPAASTGR